MVAINIGNYYAHQNDNDADKAKEFYLLALKNVSLAEALLDYPLSKYLMKIYKATPISTLLGPFDNFDKAKAFLINKLKLSSTEVESLQQETIKLITEQDFVKTITRSLD